MSVAASIKEKNNDEYLELSLRRKRYANKLAMLQFNKKTLKEQKQVTPKTILEIVKL